jgi:cytochrome c
MDSFEINKIITAILLVVLLVFGVGKISDIIFKVNKPDVEGYKVEIKTSDALVSKTSSESKVDIAALLALGDLEHGKKVFKKCAACHSIKQDGGNKIGPKLWNVMFRPVGAVSDYKYSKSLSEYKKNWTWEEMNGFLIKPATWIKGNKMGFAGLKKEKDRASVILYLNQNSDSPNTLP